MMELTPGEKIKMLRSNLGLKQEDITNNEISKSIISLIERNKRNLTWSVAKIVANNLNKYSAVMGREITPEYLMETEEDREINKVRDELNIIKGLIDKKKIDKKIVKTMFDKVITSIDILKLKKEKAELLYLKATYYYNTYEYKEAINCFTEALVYYIEEKKHKEVARIYNHIGASYHMLMAVEQAIYYYTKANDIVLINNTVNREKILIETTRNIILVYRIMKRFDLAMEYINIFKVIKCIDEQEYFKTLYNEVTVLEANTYRDLGNFIKAQQTYEKLLQIKDELNEDTLFLTYHNYGKLLFAENLDDAIYYTNKAFELKDRISTMYIPWIYQHKAKCAMRSGRYSKVFEIVNEGLAVAKELNSINKIIDFHFILIQVYIALEQYENALSELNLVESIIFKNNIKLKINDLNIFYSEVYCKLGETNKSVEYMLKGRSDYFDVV